MASTILVNTINTQSGTTISIPTGKTLAIADAGALTVGGTAVTTGSSNIQRKTADYTIVEADVSGKSELVIAANASGANRVITLPATNTTGMATCIITVVCDTAAAAANEVTVIDASSTEIWSGVEKGDFVRLIVSNGAWVVIDHKETYFEYRFLTASQSVGANAYAKWAASTSINSIGNTWDSTNDRLLVPFDAYAYVDINISSDAANEPSFSASLKIGPIGAPITKWHDTNTSSDGRVNGPNGHHACYRVTSGHIIEPWIQNNDDDTRTMDVNTVDSKNTMNQFTIQCVRRYS